MDMFLGCCLYFKYFFGVHCKCVKDVPDIILLTEDAGSKPTYEPKMRDAPLQSTQTAPE